MEKRTVVITSLSVTPAPSTTKLLFILKWSNKRKPTLVPPVLVQLMGGTPPQGDVEEASWPKGWSSAGSSGRGGAAAPLWWRCSSQPSKEKLLFWNARLSFQTPPALVLVSSLPVWCFPSALTSPVLSRLHPVESDSQESLSWTVCFDLKLLSSC